MTYPIQRNETTDRAGAQVGNSAIFINSDSAFISEIVSRDGDLITLRNGERHAVSKPDRFRVRQ